VQQAKHDKCHDCLRDIKRWGQLAIGYDKVKDKIQADKAVDNFAICPRCIDGGVTQPLFYNMQEKALKCTRCGYVQKEE
jgi:ribosomal protein S27AE